MPFVVTVSPVSPVITTVSPLEFQVGVASAITIDGSSFQPWSTVWIDGTTEISPDTVSAGQITATVPAAAIDDCQPISISVWSYDGAGGFSNAVAAAAMHNIETIDYDLAWSGFSGDLPVTGWGFADGIEGLWTDLSDVPVGGTMTATVSDANNLTLALSTAALTNGQPYYLYLDDGSGALCEPADFLADEMVPDTGQTDLQCTDSGGVFEDCSGTESAYFGQDGHYQVPPRQHAYSLDVNSGGIDDDVVIDQVTGLTWMRCPAGSGAGPSCASPAELQYDDGGGNTPAFTFCDDLVLDGHGNWRLPTFHELLTIVDASVDHPAIDSTYFESPPDAGSELLHFWTDTPHPIFGSFGYILTVQFGTGRSDGWEDFQTYFVRCVTDTSSALNPSLSDETTNIVLDDATHLMWTKSSFGTADWQAALDGCESLELDGYDDWRLPDRNELMTIVDVSVTVAPTIDTGFFPDTQSARYWTSTSDFGDESFAWHIDFDSAAIFNNFGKAVDTHYYRCVR